MGCYNNRKDSDDGTRFQSRRAAPMGCRYQPLLIEIAGERFVNVMQQQGG